MFKIDSGRPKRLAKLEIREYLRSWVENGLWSGTCAMTIIHAFNEEKSLVDWFGSSNIEYDDDYALEFLESYMTEAN